HPSKKDNAESGPVRVPLRAGPETHIGCALPLGKGATLSVETKHTRCTFQISLSMQRLFQQAARACNQAGGTLAR
ncbi:acetyl-CoA acetyltransferase [Reinekea sp. MED297]|nr:acetyl-CoA acetyltransferase [Reinekea sp. MED297] [Reinekea blandensis MED297]